MKQTKQKLALALVFSTLLLTGCSSCGHRSCRGRAAHCKRR